MYTPLTETKTLSPILARRQAHNYMRPIPYGKLGRSDHQPFHELGIPAALFIHSPVEPWYHKPDNTLDKRIRKKLKRTAEIVAASTFQIVLPGQN
ncbi:M28 family peptidase [Fictibacillus sp. S7]|uniref:M28 family peptidase n=1 Tax=Fictibacillus sp. S7 TaxID=2212476 RepID=UPI001F520C4C|nr:M28 family peptidase [Fictibacillus sp. S7]